MLYSLINGEKTIASIELKKNKITRGVCDFCGKPTLLRAGECNIPHFAHIELSPDCEGSEGETEWHKNCKSAFPSEQVEITFSHNGVVKRCDVKTPYKIIEFQHSPITSDEIEEREKFYMGVYGDMIWVFDLTSAYKEGRFQIREPKYGCGNNFTWKKANKHIFTCRRPVFLDLGEDKLFHMINIYASKGYGSNGYGQFVDKNEVFYKKSNELELFISKMFR